MRQLFLLICVYLLLSGQVIAAASSAGGIYEGDTPPKTSGAAAPAAKGFLDAYDPEKITPATFMSTIGPFIGNFIMLGKILHKIQYDDPRNRKAWQEKRQQFIHTLQSPDYLYEPDHGDDPVAPEPILFIAHTMAPKDFEIAKVVYLLSQTWETCPIYAQVEIDVWAALQPIMGFDKSYVSHLRDLESIVSPQDVTAMDLWVFLTAIGAKAFPPLCRFERIKAYPLLSRFEKPSDPTKVEPRDDIDFLTRVFTKLVIDYGAARKARLVSIA